MTTLKLYRGLSAEEFQLATDEILKANKAAWTAILSRRAEGNFSYPVDLDKSITALHKSLRYENQYFTDARDIAEGYARKVGGLLVELTVPLADVLKAFDVEFQNYGQRKSRFEIVYRVKGSDLAKNAKRWTLEVRKLK